MSRDTTLGRRGMCVALVAAFAAVMPVHQNGGMAMAAETVKLGWEFRAKRALSQRVALRLDSVKKERRGLFGIANAPSLGGSIPDPMAVTGVALVATSGGTVGRGGQVAFRIPRVALDGAASGDRVALGIIGTNAVCLTPVPDTVSDDDLAGWLPSAPCD